MRLKHWLAFVGTVSTGLVPWSAVQAASSNPFFQPSPYPYQAPAFDRIKESDYQPAFERGMAEHLREVRQIAANTAPPSFENTIVALEKAGRLLDRVTETFFGVYQANSTPVLDRVQSQEAPRLAQHQDAISLNGKLFARIKALYHKRAQLHLNPEQTQLLDLYYQQFVHAGAMLPEPKKARLRAINTREAQLEAAYQQRLVAAAREGALVVERKDALRGLSDSALLAARKAADERHLPGHFLLSLQNTVQQPELEALHSRETRKALFDASWRRAERGDAHDTRAIIAEISQLRAEKAALFGYPNYAAYVLYDQMAKTPETAAGFIQQLVPALARAQKKEAALLQEAMARDGEHGTLQPWDWPYYAEKVKRERFALNQDEVKPYFELHTVLTKGVFYAAERLYGLHFTQRTDIPTYHPDVMVYEVFDEDNRPLGLMYFDYFKRDTKSGGAWMSNFVGQSHLLGTKPVIYNVANFAKAPVGQPQLITPDDVVTMFHEFGHALHGLFANQTYPTLSGTNVARDFVEFPSQFNENWAFYPEVLSHYAHHYQTGAQIPDTLVAKMQKAATFNQAYALGEIVTAAELDLRWHALSAPTPRQDVDTFEEHALSTMGLDVAQVPPRYRSSTFLHIWSNGYAAGYYAYLWTEMLDQDAFSWFREHGGLTRKNGQRFRDMILSQGHTQDYGPMFRAFYGKNPDIFPMLIHRGLESSTTP